MTSRPLIALKLKVADRLLVTDDNANRNNILRIKHQRPKPGVHEDSHRHVRPHNEDVAVTEHPAWDSAGVSPSKSHDSGVFLSNQQQGHQHSTKDFNSIPNRLYDSKEHDRKAIGEHCSVITGLCRDGSEVSNKSSPNNSVAATTLNDRITMDQNELLQAGASPDKSESSQVLEYSGPTTPFARAPANSITSESCDSNPSPLVIPSILLTAEGIPIDLQVLDRLKRPVKFPTLFDRRMSEQDADQIRRLVPKQGSVVTGDGIKREASTDERATDTALLETIDNSNVPLLSHECPQSGLQGHPLSYPQMSTAPRSHSIPSIGVREPSAAEMLSDPSVEIFPTEPKAILRRIATIHQELREDDSIDGISPSSYLSQMLSREYYPALSHELPFDSPSSVYAETSTGRYSKTSYVTRNC